MGGGEISAHISNVPRPAGSGTVATESGSGGCNNGGIGNNHEEFGRRVKRALPWTPEPSLLAPRNSGVETPVSSKRRVRACAVRHKRHTIMWGTLVLLHSGGASDLLETVRNQRCAAPIGSPGTSRTDWCHSRSIQARRGSLALCFCRCSGLMLVAQPMCSRKGSGNTPASSDPSQPSFVGRGTHSFG